ECFGVIEACSLERSARLQPRRHRSRGEESFCPARGGEIGTHLVEEIACAIAQYRRRPGRVRAHLCPELAQPINAGLGWITCDDRCVDRSHRNPGDPVGMDACLCEGFIDTSCTRRVRRRLARPRRRIRMAAVVPQLCGVTDTENSWSTLSRRSLN